MGPEESGYAAEVFVYVDTGHLHWHPLGVRQSLSTSRVQNSLITISDGSSRPKST